jgi:hypothetical protein
MCANRLNIGNLKTGYQTKAGTQPLFKNLSRKKRGALC